MLSKTMLHGCSEAFRLKIWAPISESDSRFKLRLIVVRSEHNKHMLTIFFGLWTRHFVLLRGSYTEHAQIAFDVLVWWNCLGCMAACCRCCGCLMLLFCNHKSMGSLTGVANRRCPWGHCAYPQGLCTTKWTSSTPCDACAYTPPHRCVHEGLMDKTWQPQLQTKTWQPQLQTRTHMHTRTRTHANAHARAPARTPVHESTHVRPLQSSGLCSGKRREVFWVFCLFFEHFWTFF